MRFKFILAAFLILGFSFTAKQPSSNISFSGTTDNISIEEVSHAYNHALPNSTITWYITDSPGGNIFSGNTVARMIVMGKQKNVHTVFKIKGYCHSMCALLATTADRVEVDNNVPFIFHAIQLSFFIFHGVDTSSPLFKAHMRFWNPYVKRVLLPDEYQAMMEGKDVIVFGNRIKSAVNRK